jgi:hypothetical protein
MGNPSSVGRAPEAQSWLFVPNSLFGSQCDQIGFDARALMLQPNFCDLPQGTAISSLSRVFHISDILVLISSGTCLGNQLSQLFRSGNYTVQKKLRLYHERLRGNATTAYGYGISAVFSLFQASSVSQTFSWSSNACAAAGSPWSR